MSDTALVNADDDRLFADLADESDDIRNQLAHGKPLTPGQARAFDLLLQRIYPGGKTPATRSDRTKEAIEYGQRLQRFADMLQAVSNEQQPSSEFARKSMQELLKLAEDLVNEFEYSHPTRRQVALLKGAQEKMELLGQREGCVNGTEFARLLGVDRNTPRKQWERGRALAVRTGGRLHYPFWQLETTGTGPEDCRVLRGIRDVVAIAKSNDANDWDLLSFFLSDNVHLEIESKGNYSIPIEALKAGEKELVIDVAQMTFADE